ncbi:site-specific integrase [Bacillus sp. FSL W7-1360]
MADGSIIEEGKGKYKLVVELPTTVDVNGKKKRNRRCKTIHASGPRAAKKALQKFVAEKEQEFAAAEKKQERIPFVKFVEEKWLKNFAEDYYAHTTLENYLYTLNSRILPSFDRLWLDQISTMHIVEYLKKLSDDVTRNNPKKSKLSSSTLEFNYRILKSIFKQAVLWDFIQDDPMKGVTKPKRKVKEKPVYDTNLVRILFNSLEKEDPRWHCLILLTVSSGLRREEVLGLESKHIDYEKNIIQIQQAVTYTKKEGLVVGDLKTEGSRRELYISPSLLQLLLQLDNYKKEERITSGTNWSPGACFLFSDQDGKPFHPDYVSTWWRRFTKRKELPYINFHALRHTAATVLINQGVHAKVISTILGHTNITTTMNIYGHTLKEAHESAANVFEKMYKDRSTATSE